VLLLDLHLEDASGLDLRSRSAGSRASRRSRPRLRPLKPKFTARWQISAPSGSSCDARNPGVGAA
jgi:hypothetical protein